MFKTKEYFQYHNMVARCSTTLQKQRPRYLGSFLNPEWKLFNNYLKWAENQVGFMNKEPNGRIWSIDKDIIKVGNKEYGPEYCVFVPNEVNQFFNIMRTTKKSHLPSGVTKTTESNNFQVRLSIAGKDNYFGSYTNFKDAELKYLEVKKSLALKLVEKWESKLDNRVINQLLDFPNWYNVRAGNLSVNI